MIQILIVPITRMRRNDTTNVSDVWDAFRHGKNADYDEVAKKAARAVLCGSSGDDPTGGATHYYSPGPMPVYTPPPKGTSAAEWQKQEKAKYPRYDIGGGKDDQKAADGKYHYRPGYTTKYDQFESVGPVRGVSENYFRFCRQKGSGRVS